MTISGGNVFMSANPLLRLYRHVRADPFMQPFGEYEMLEYVGKVVFGVDPQLDCTRRRRIGGLQQCRVAAS